MTAIVANPADHYLADYEAFARNGGAAAPEWLKDTRRAAIARFGAVGFPTSRQEEWRFTSVAGLTEAPFVRAGAAGGAGPLATPAQVHALEICEAHRHLVVFVNGRHVPALSSVTGLPEGVIIGSLADALRAQPALVERHLGRYAGEAGSPFTALNTAFVDDGAFVYVPANVRMDEPIQLLFLSHPVAGGAPTVSHPRTLVVVERLGRAAIVETYGSADGAAYWTNAVSEVVAGDGARVDVYRVQRDSRRAYHTAATHTHQGRDSTLTLHPVVFGAALSRHDIVARLAGENGHCTLNGLYILAGTQHADHHTTIDHATPHCESHEYFNGVLDEKSRGVFTGRIIVRPGAQRTDSKQTNNNLLLSEEARADSQPQLEIYADDVKCTHGATLGPIDQQAMFYLTSRGITRAEARSLVTYGFGAEIIDRMEIAPLQAQLDRLVRRRILGAESVEA